MLRRGWLSLLILCCSLPAKGIDAVVSHTLFYMKDTGKTSIIKPYIEVYWQINPLSLKYTRTGQMISAKIKTDIVFRNAAGIIDEAHFLQQTPQKTIEKDAANENIIDLHRFVLPNGNIKMYVTLTDALDSNNRYSYTDSFNIDQPAIQPLLSGIQLLDTFYASTAAGRYQKNDYQQIPLCANFYDDNRKALTYYAELYNAKTVEKDELPLIKVVTITKKETESIAGNLVKKDTLKINEVTPLLGTFDITTLPSGNYNLNVTILNNSSKPVTNATVFFQRYSTYKKVDTAVVSQHSDVVENINVLNLGETFVGKYSLAQIKSILKMLLPFSDHDGIQTISGFLKRPNETYMRYYVYNFFSAINKENPEKAWEAFTVKIKEVNKLFSTGSNAGYETDRGIIYLRYGPPTDRAVVENETGTYPYEVWQYNTATSGITHKKTANAVFLFYRPSDMLDDFRLLHSTVPGEPRNTSWRDYLYTKGTEGRFIGSKAEQYLNDQ